MIQTTIFSHNAATLDTAMSMVQDDVNELIKHAHIRREDILEYRTQAETLNYVGKVKFSATISWWSDN